MESSEPKKYPPTEKKLRDLKKKGQFPKTELAEPTFELLVFAQTSVLSPNGRLALTTPRVRRKRRRLILFRGKVVKCCFMVTLECFNELH